jgi:hypothetical protein
VEDFMGFMINSIDQKQHLNLSDQAWVSIDDDIFNFFHDETQRNLSGFLNTIIKNFYEISVASISYEVDRLSDQLEQVFLDQKLQTYDKQTKKAFMHQMISVLEKELLSQVQSYPKGEGRKFRINNENLELLEDSIEDVYYQGSLGLYLKAMFEEYARKPYFEREKIYFKDYVYIIERAIEKSTLLKITLENNRKFYVSPYQLVMDKSATFNYLVGYSIPVGEEKSKIERMSSFRLSRIIDMKQIRSKSGKITLEQQKKLETELNLKGPQFLSSDSIEIKVKLTKKGIEKYRSQINLRPNYTHIEDGDIYVFHCTEVQIQYYFFKFGKDAVILSPLSLKERFKRYYESSLSNYK